MANTQYSPVSRRWLLAGAGASAIVLLPGCESVRRWSLIDAIRRLLERASANALARLMAPGGFWDNQLARLDLPDVFGKRGNALQAILTSAVFKSRLQKELNHVAERGARRAAPVIADAVRIIGIDNARALVEGGPRAATGFLRSSMGGQVIDAMVPELDEGLRLANDPVVSQALAALSGVDIAGAVRSLAFEADEAIWGEIGREEEAIRANPQATGDPLLIGVFGVA